MDGVLEQIYQRFSSMCILRKFPESGQKEVYLATVSGYGKVMLKIIKHMDERTRREIDIVNDHDIPGVPKIQKVDNVIFDEVCHTYLLEEYIDGLSLAEILQKTPSIGTKEVVKLLDYLLDVTRKLETIRIVHRDIKPANIIRDKAGNYHLIDFGIARNLNLTSITQTMLPVGPHTPGYGAPELFQNKKQEIDSRADLFSIGVVAYQAVTGKHPFLSGDETDFGEIWYKTRTVMPKDEKLEGDPDQWLMSFIKTLMQKQISKRPPSAKKAMEWFSAVKKTLTV